MLTYLWPPQVIFEVIVLFCVLYHIWSQCRNVGLSYAAAVTQDGLPFFFVSLSYYPAVGTWLILDAMADTDW